MEASFMTLLAIIGQSMLIMSQPTTIIEQGEIIGKTELVVSEYLGIDQEVDVFLGIPFAEPPIGDRRFADPVPKEPWAEDEVYDATFFRDICAQSGTGSLGSYNQSEDCLHLNVFAPKPKPTNAAVMVYMHGGGFSTGNSYDYSGIGLSAVGDVVVVTINYRLGAIGLLVTGDESATGNYALLDQAEALRWVQRNIHAFGGDPDKVTIFGQSAGGGAVSAHLFSPMSRDLFDKAILQSGSMLYLTPDSTYLDKEKQREDAFKLGAAVGCTTTSTQELVECMRTVDAQEIIDAAATTLYAGSPCVDNKFFFESPVTSLEKNDFKKCPMINGFTQDDGTLYILVSELGFGYWGSPTPPYVSEEIFDKEVDLFLTLQGAYNNDLIKDSIKQEYVNWAMADDPEADYFDPWAKYAGDKAFSCPSVMESRYHAMAAEGADYGVYQYLFSHVPTRSVWDDDPNLAGTGWLGAGHGEDITFVFGYPIIYSIYNMTDEEKDLAQNMIMYWTNFAKTGNPGKESDSSTPYDDEQAWPAFTVPELQFKDLAVNLTSGRGLRADECHFWNYYIPQLTTFSGDMDQTEKEWREEFYSWKYTDMEDWRDAFDKYQEEANKMK